MGSEIIIIHFYGSGIVLDLTGPGTFVYEFHFNRCLTMLLSPLLAAVISGVNLLCEKRNVYHTLYTIIKSCHAIYTTLLTGLGSAPLGSSSTTTCSCPYITAMCSGVQSWNGINFIMIVINSSYIRITTITTTVMNAKINSEGSYKHITLYGFSALHQFKLMFPLLTASLTAARSPLSQALQRFSLCMSIIMTMLGCSNWYVHIHHYMQ